MVLFVKMECCHSNMKISLHAKNVPEACITVLMLFSLQVPEMYEDSCPCAAVSIICLQQYHVAGLVQVCDR
jgi:hypothetical protein